MKWPMVKLLCLVSCTFLLVTPSLAQNDFKKTGTFSSLKYHTEAGDLLGAEIKIVWTKSGYQAVLQIAEGAPEQLIIVDIKFEGNKISFRIPTSQPYAGTFSGQISSKNIIGTLKLNGGGVMHLDLTRKKSYWD